MEATTLNALRTFHLVAAILMAWPFYSLIITGQRARLGPPIDRADTYMEDIIRQQSIRCFVFQISILVTGAAIAFLGRDTDLGAFVENWRLVGKVGFLVLLLGMNGYMVFRLQPRIDRRLPRAAADVETAREMARLRGRRRWMAAVCLWYVLMASLLGIQAWVPFNEALTGVLALAAALFVWRTYRGLAPWGWV